MKRGYLLLIIILLIIIIFGIWLYIRKPDTEVPVIEPEIIEMTIENVTDRNNYYMVENCVKKFYKYCSSIYENKNPEEEDVIKTYNLLDKQYIDFKNINKENLHTVLVAMNDSVVNIYDMYVSKQNEEISAYIVKGDLRDITNNKLSDFQIMIKIDFKNKTFSVLLQDYMQAKYKNLDIGSKIAVDLSNIEKNKNNTYVLEEISDKTYMLDLFNRYKEEVIYNVELAYEHLNKEYSSIKFGTLENFKEYAKDNIDKHTNMQLEKYKVSQEDGYKQYIGVDKNEYYYIFQETGLMKYTLVLDSYTINLPEFLRKYNAAGTVDKVGYNIQKILEAINYKDYEYVYNKLDLEFMANNYVTIEQLKRDIEENLFEKNKVKDVSSYTEGMTYIFKLVITDINDNKKEQPMTVVMKLKEGTDFVMAFSFQ